MTLYIKVLYILFVPLSEHIIYHIHALILNNIPRQARRFASLYLRYLAFLDAIPLP